MNIRNFKKLDEIVRVEAAKNLGQIETMDGHVIDRGGDRSYIGEKMVFLGSANGMIYLERSDSFMIEISKKNTCSVPMDLYSEGWESWIDPESLTGNTCSKTDLEKQIDEAIKKEDYELAERLTKKLEDLK